MKINTLLGAVALCLAIVAVSAGSGPAATEDGAEGEAKVCVGEWCVDFETDAITLAGKPQSFVDCARNETCGRILAETWIAALEDQEHVDIPISDSTVLRLGRDGTIRNASSGEVFMNCAGPSGPISACVVAFLLELSKPMVYDLGSAPEKPGPLVPASKPQGSTEVGPSSEGPTAATPALKSQTAPNVDKSRRGPAEAHKAPKAPFPKAEAKRGQVQPSRAVGTSDSGSFSPPDALTGSFFNPNEMQQELIERRWEDVERMGL
jgi:hypothetical protein